MYRYDDIYGGEESQIYVYQVDKDGSDEQHSWRLGKQESGASGTYDSM